MEPAASTSQRGRDNDRSLRHGRSAQGLRDVVSRAVVNRMGRGYSFDVIRARLLFDQEARKPTSGVVRTKSPRPVAGGRSGGFAAELLAGAAPKKRPALQEVIEERSRP